MTATTDGSTGALQPRVASCLQDSLHPVLLDLADLQVGQGRTGIDLDLRTGDDYPAVAEQREAGNLGQRVFGRNEPATDLHPEHQLTRAGGVLDASRSRSTFAHLRAARRQGGEDHQAEHQATSVIVHAPFDALDHGEVPICC